eukprot:2264336-Pleurochrysis_carterae.AAC.1
MARVTRKAGSVTVSGPTRTWPCAQQRGRARKRARACVWEEEEGGEVGGGGAKEGEREGVREG